MSKLFLLVLLSFVGITAYGQEKKVPASDSLQKKASLKKSIKAEIDTTLHAGKKKAAQVKKQLVNQKDKTKADAKEIYQTVFIARDTSLLKEQTIKISSVVTDEAKKIKSSAKEYSPNKVKGSAVQNVNEEMNQVRDVAGDQKGQIKSTVKSAYPKNLDSAARKEGKQQVSQAKDQLKEEKDKMKTEIKKPIDFDLSMDNNGTQTKSLTHDNLEQKLKEMKDFKLGPGKIGQRPNASPAIGQPSKSADQSKSMLEGKNMPSVSDLEKKGLDGKSGIPESKGVKKLKNTIERVSTVDSKGALETISELTNVKTILSQKHLIKLRDSLGLKKFDSLFNKASLWSKKEVGKEDLLQALNKPFAGKSKLDESTFDQKNVLGAAQQEVAGQAKGFDPLSGKLPQPLLEKLPPLSGNLLDSKYMMVIDSLRKIKLNEQRLKLTEKKMTKDFKETVFKKKPKFWDKAYFDGIVGVAGNDNATIVQASPSLGYHILPLFSIGLGPTFSIQKQDKGINSSIGMRSFAKMELFKQRAYLQTEYQISPYQVDYKNLNVAHGNLLAGGGVVKSLYGKIAINVSLLYRVNSNDILPGASPWVFRMGISTVKVDK
jgi:hypothetical protein